MRLNFGILKRPNSPIPGFGLTIGYTVFYLSIIVIIPLIALFTEAFITPPINRVNFIN